jgi:CheY-like chemotaxis protein
VCIVIVEDQADIRVTLAHLLEDEGYRVLCFGHPVPVTELHSSDELPQLFLIDIMLPDMDGIALARRLGYTRFATTPKIAMSASAQALAEAQESHRFHGFLGKPFDLDELLNTVEQHLHS